MSPVVLLLKLGARTIIMTILQSCLLPGKKNPSTALRKKPPTNRTGQHAPLIHLQITNKKRSAIAARAGSKGMIVACYFFCVTCRLLKAKGEHYFG